MANSLKTAKQLRKDIRAMTRAQAEGDTLTAYDLAQKHIEKERLSLGLQYHMVLAMARVGLTDRAITLYDEWQLIEHLKGTHRSEIAGLAARLAEYRANVKLKRDRKANDSKPGSRETRRTQLTADYYTRAYEDVAAIGARLQKDRAWISYGADRRNHARLAAVAYAQVFEDTEGFYVGVNCAGMHLIAGDPATAAATADQVLAKWKGRRGDIVPEEQYLFAAMMTQAVLLATHFSKWNDSVPKWLNRMQDPKHRPKNLIEASTMIKQITYIHDQLQKNIAESESKKSRADIGKPAEPKKIRKLIKNLPRPSVVHYCGHMATVPGARGRLPHEAQDDVRNRIKKTLEKLNVGAGYGSLACGADILFAEELIKRRAELHVVLPFEEEEFIETSVRRGGVEWIGRFRKCLKKATSRTIATRGGFLGDVALFRYGGDIAMGQAMMRANTLNLPCRQICVWDEKDHMQIAGTSENVKRWQLHNKKRTIKKILCRSNTKDLPYSSSVTAGQGYGREIRAFLFGDIKGFSKIPEERLPSFSDTVIELFASVIRKLEPGNEIEDYNTWGDGLFLVLKDAAAAAKCALRLQESMEKWRSEFVAAGLPGDLQLRLGGHIGPVLQKKDHVLKKLAWCGTTIAKAARIEPVTEPGDIFITDSFAAILAVEAGTSKYECEYVGNRASAKDYGQFRMYRLQRKKNATGA